MNKSLLIAALAAACPAGAMAATDPGALAPLPTATEKKARLVQTWQNQINLPYANQLGKANGSGVLVGIADTGAEISNAMLRGQVVKSYNVFDASTSVPDTVGHGTHVAGLVAGTTANGATYQGVAMGAKLAIAKVFDGSGSTSSTRIDQGINWLVNTAKAPIISLSLGGSSPANLLALRDGVAKGVLFTIAAGNDGKASVSWPAHYASQAWANNQIIVVGAVDANNKLASFSNYGADTAAWYVVAPGVNVASSYLGNQAAYMSGTSMATPIVAGQAALIKSNWSFLGASTISQIIFKTATHLGKGTDTAPDPVYGWGLINVARSMGPVGALLSATAGKPVALGSALMVSSVGTFSTKSLGFIGVDQFGRGFDVDVGKNLQAAVPAAANAGILFGAFDRQEALVEQVHGRQSLTYGGGDRLAIASRSANGTIVGAGSGSMSASFFGLAATGLAPFAASGEGKFNAPYFGMVHDARHAGVSMMMGESRRLRLGVLTEGSAQGEVLPTLTPYARRTLVSVEIEQRSGRAVGVFSGGILRESGSLLGSMQGSAMAFNSAARTMFISLSLGYELTPQLSLVSMASAGHTAGFQNADSLVSQVSSVGTVAYSAGLAARQIFSSDDRFGLTLTVPTKVTKGALSLTGAVAQHDDGSLSYATRTLNLAPSATERDLEMTYSQPLDKVARLSGALMLRMNPGHEAQTPHDMLLGVRYSRKF
ncbi:MAG: S8 family serine peptidase [Pseudomonadota bacterium]